MNAAMELSLFPPRPLPLSRYPEAGCLREDGAVELWMAVWPIGGHRSPCIAGDGKKWRHGEPINAIRFSARQSVGSL